MEKIVLNCELKANDGGEANLKTEVRLSRENDSLNLLFICEARDIISKGKTYNDKLYEGDVVELFLTLGERTKYLELEVNPSGVDYAAVVTNDGQGIKLDYLPKSPFKNVTVITANGWRSEWKIPLENLRKLGFKEDNAYYNLYRQDFCGEELNLYALNPTECKTFHKTEKFIKLKI